MSINTQGLTLFLIQEFKQLGKEKTLGSFTIEELDDLAEHINTVVSTPEKPKSLADDEPPF